MKSPTTSVGRIDDDGILNGSATNERSRKTIRSTGKKLFGYSIHHGSRASGARSLAKWSLSASAITPVRTVARNRISAKFMAGAFVGIRFGSLVADLEDREKRLLWNLDAADGLHPLLSGLLLFEELLLARDVAAVAFGEDVLAHRLDRLTGDDLRTDRRLDGD